MLLSFNLLTVIHLCRENFIISSLHTKANKYLMLRKMSWKCYSEDTNVLLDRVRKIIPILKHDKHKGESGRIGVVGGSLEYTGAPYFSAISALKVGADLVHVFCQQAAAPVIKSYSPELIVHPLLDSEDAVKQIEPWLERLHILIIGPGLGRQENIMQTVIQLINVCRHQKKPLIIDADGLHIVTQNIDVIKDYENVILTPNIVEFTRLFGGDKNSILDRVKSVGNGVTILEKGQHDKVYMPGANEIFELSSGGSPRRCGGQGDLLSGALATFYNWSLNSKDPNPSLIASFAACYLTKSCNAYAFKKYGRSSICGNMIDEIHTVFDEAFEGK